MADNHSPAAQDSVQAAAEAKLVQMCEDFAMQGDALAKNDIVALEAWFKDFGPSNIPAIARLGQTLKRVTADRKATLEEQEELSAAITAAMAPEVRAAVEAKQRA